MFYRFYVHLTFFFGGRTWDQPGHGSLRFPETFAGAALPALRGFGAAMEAFGKALRWRRGMELVGQMRLVQVGWEAFLAPKMVIFYWSILMVILMG